MSGLSRLRSRRFERWFFSASALVFIAGVVAFLIIVVGNTGTSQDTPLSNQPARVLKEEKSVTLPLAARRVIAQFIRTAPARRNLAASWAITHPRLKQGYTLDQWKKGDIPVIPYRAKDPARAPMRVDYAYPREAMVEVALQPADGVALDPLIFKVGVRLHGSGKNKRWLVDYWAPRYRPRIPIPE